MSKFSFNLTSPLMGQSELIHICSPFLFTASISLNDRYIFNNILYSINKIDSDSLVSELWTDMPDIIKYFNNISLVIKENGIQFR